MTKEEIFEAYIAWEYDVGEALLDQGFNINALTFMSWCLGRGYIDSNRYNLWATLYISGSLEAKDPNNFVYSDEPFAVVYDSEFTQEGYNKSVKIVAEFISEIDIYIERFQKFIAGDEGDE